MAARIDRRPGKRPAREAPAGAGRALRVFLSHGSPRILLVAVAAAWTLRALLGPPAWGEVLLALAIVAFWPLNEWLIHVFILHLRPRRVGPLRLDLAVARDHRRHHADPWNLRWVFIPLHVFAPALALLVALALLLPTAELSATALAVYLTLSLHHEWVHYLAHIRWQPPLAYWRRRVHEHRLHHFRHHRRWWGVSTGLADRWFGTAPDPATVSPRIAPLPDGTPWP